MRALLHVLMLTLMLAPLLAAAQGRPPAERERPRPWPEQSRAGQGMRDAVRRVERQTGGQVLNVESLRFQGREIHRVKVLEPGGRIRIVVDDPGRRGDNAPEPAFRSTRGDDGRDPNL